jgi:LacI family transcriptional regulator
MTASPPGRKGPGTPGIREIARTLGVSIGTVDRAFHDRPGISALTRAKVLALAEELEYRPNLAARYLSSSKEIRIGVVLPRKIASFWDVVRDGISSAAHPLEVAGVRVEQHFYPHPGEGEMEAFEQCLAEKVDGLIIASFEPEKVGPFISRASSRGVPVVCVNTDAPGTARLTTVAVDPLTNGSLVGELMGRFLQGNGLVVVITGTLTAIDHARKLQGFRATMGELWPGLEIGGVVEAHDEEAEAYDKCRQLLSDVPGVAGVYVSTANSLPVLEAIRDAGLDGKVTVITTDLFPALAPFLESSRVAATIHQRPWTQGRIALQALHAFLVDGTRPSPLIELSPNIVMRSNLKLLLERVRPRTKAAPSKRAPRHGV